jgi:hypothetical protein
MVGVAGFEPTTPCTRARNYGFNRFSNFPQFSTKLLILQWNYDQSRAIVFSPFVLFFQGSGADLAQVESNIGVDNTTIERNNDEDAVSAESVVGDSARGWNRSKL